MYIRHAFIAALLFCATTLSAEIVSAFDLSAKPIGSITRWQTDSGNTTIEVLAHDGKLFKLAFSRDASIGQPDFAILWARRDGQVVERTDSSGEWTRYKPHNCALTLGKCRYTEKHSLAPRRKMIRVATREGDRISYALYHTKISPANLVERGSFTVDQYGYVIDSEHVGTDGSPHWSQRVGGVK